MTVSKKTIDKGPGKAFQENSPHGPALLSGISDDAVLKKFLDQKMSLMNLLTEKKHYFIGTLGPVGTTSYEAARFFMNYLGGLNFGNAYEIKLRNTFELICEALLDYQVDFIVIPNAYENITAMYWNPDLHNLFSFLFETPRYGLAVRRGPGNGSNGGRKRVAVCKPVLCLVDKLGGHILGKPGEYEIVNAYSTTESVEFALAGKAEYALTNETSIRGTDLQFVSATCTSNVLWSVFNRKT